MDYDILCKFYANYMGLPYVFPIDHQVPAFVRLPSSHRMIGVQWLPWLSGHHVQPEASFLNSNMQILYG